MFLSLSISVFLNTAQSVFIRVVNWLDVKFNFISRTHFKEARSCHFKSFCLILSIMSSKRQIGRASKSLSFAKSRPHNK